MICAKHDRALRSHETNRHATSMLSDMTGGFERAPIVRRIDVHASGLAVAKIVLAHTESKVFSVDYINLLLGLGLTAIMARHDGECSCVEVLCVASRHDLVCYLR